MDDWVVEQVSVLGIRFQNWMVVIFVLALVAALINVVEKSRSSR